MIENKIKWFSLFSHLISESLRGGTLLKTDYYTSILAVIRYLDVCIMNSNNRIDIIL